MKQFLRFIIINSIILNAYAAFNIGELSKAYDKKLLNDLERLDKNKRFTNRFFSLSNLILKIFNIDKDDPYHTVTAKVRLSNSLCQEEQDFLKQRKLVVKEKLQNLLAINIPDEKVPTIAICGSGGGYRAMIYTLGSFLGAEDLLETTTYVVGLSGTTWLISSWLAHKYKLLTLKDLIREQVSFGLTDDFEIKDMVSNGVYKYLYDQKLSLVGIWGGLIANRIFSDFEGDSVKSRLSRKECPKLTHSKARIENGFFPMPIYTAIEVSDPKEYDWIEFTPFEVGSNKQQTYVPAWSFGRKFNNGESVNFAPECGLDFLLGIWGSAFTASLFETLKIYKKQIPSILFAPTEEILGNPEFGLGNLRLSPAKVLNFAKGIKDHKWMKDRITLVDGGLDFNLPIPPLLKKDRKIDLIIIIDSSAIVDEAPELKEAEDYAKANNLKFPKINYENIDKNIISVFKDINDSEVPVVIYLPRIKNENYSKTFDPTALINSLGYCHTFNLKYTPEQFNELAGLGEFNMKASKNRIIDEIKYVISRK